MIKMLCKIDFGTKRSIFQKERLKETFQKNRPKKKQKNKKKTKKN